MVISTFPDAPSAQQAAQNLVSARLAACVNCVPGATSHYLWEGKMEMSTEIIFIAKTTRACYPQLEQTLRSLHPYELPEIIALPVSTGLPAYLRWVSDNTNAGEQ